MKSDSGKILPAVLIVLALIIVAGTVGAIFYADYIQGKRLKEETTRTPFGVFTGVSSTDKEAVKKLYEYDAVVINAENIDKADIAALKNERVKTYAYLSLATLTREDPAFKRYEECAVDDCGDVYHRVWMDVTKHEWLEYILAKIGETASKGVDGFFLDGCSIYAYASAGTGAEKLDSGAVRDSLISVLSEVTQHYYKKAYVVNADTFVSYLLRNNSDIKKLIAGVNQECIVTAVNPDTGKFEEGQSLGYYDGYLKKCRDAGLDIFVTEFATDEKIKAKVAEYCKTNNYHYYISERLFN